MIRHLRAEGHRPVAVEGEAGVDQTGSELKVGQFLDVAHPLAKKSETGTSTDGSLSSSQ